MPHLSAYPPHDATNFVIEVIYGFFSRESSLVVYIQGVPQLSSHFVLVVFSASRARTEEYFTIFNSPGDVDSKTHLTFLITSKIDQVTAQNVRQTGF